MGGMERVRVLKIEVARKEDDDDKPDLQKEETRDERDNSCDDNNKQFLMKQLKK